jgi:hypothetical protein
VSLITTGLFLVFGKQWLVDLSNAAWFVLERTKLLLGAVYVLRFLAYLMLVFEK